MDFNLRTGYSQNGDEQFQQNYIDDIMVPLGVFTDDAMRLASIYCLHSNRHSVTPNDVELGLKTRAYHGEIFWNRYDIQQKMKEVKDFLTEEESEQEESEQEESEQEESEQEYFIKSECICEICTTLNGIKDKWNLWNPSNRMEETIRNSINQIFTD